MTRLKTSVIGTRATKSCQLKKSINKKRSYRERTGKEIVRSEVEVELEEVKLHIFQRFPSSATYTRCSFARVHSMHFQHR